MRGFTGTASGRVIAGCLSFLIAVPPAFAQHMVKAIQDAARASGILRDDETEYDAKLRTLVLAFDPASPLEALQKLAALAKGARLQSNGRGDISIRQICTFYENLRANPAYINSPSWKSFENVHGRFFSYLLYNGDSYCGSGALQSIVIQDAPDGRYVSINLKNRIDYNFASGNYSTSAKAVRYRLSDDPRHAARLMSDYATGGKNFEDLFKDMNTVTRESAPPNKTPNRERQNLDAEEVASALTNVREGALKGDGDKVVRALSNYDVLNITPVQDVDRVIYKPKNGGTAQVEISDISLLSPHAIADRVHGADPVPFDKGIAVVRAYDIHKSPSDFSVTHATDARIAQVPIPLDSRNDIAPEWKPVVAETLKSVNTLMESHFNSIQNAGIGVMYGDTSKFALMADEEKAAFIRQNLKPGYAPPHMEETSCVGFVLNNLEKGYIAAGKKERWREIMKVMIAHKSDGTFLLQELKKDGWTTVYFNPDVRNPDPSVDHPTKTPDHHIWTASEVKKGIPYLSGVKLDDGTLFSGIPIDAQLLNYRPTILDPNNPDQATLRQTPARTDALKKIQRTPLFVGIANGGEHVFLGSQGQVIESHTIRGPTDPSNVGIRPFSEWGLLRGESYLSGVIAVPPGGW